MDIQLLPKDSNRVDYKTYESGIIYRQYLLNDNVYHFTLHPELYPQGNELGFTGRYLAVVTSVRGLETFYIAPDDEGEFFVDYDGDESDADLQVERDMQQMLKEANIEPVSPPIEAEFDLYPTDDDSNDLNNEPIEGMDWLNFNPEESLLPLMVTAIEEFRQP